LIACRALDLIDDFESKGWCICSQSELDTVGTGSRAMLDTEMQVLGLATQIEIGVAPGM
jgi:hypothetical protein